MHSRDRATFLSERLASIGLTENTAGAGSLPLQPESGHR